MKIRYWIVVFALSVGAFFYWKRTQGATVNVVCETTKGKLELVIEPRWSPRGAERFLQMVEAGFYQDVPLFRCVDRFLCQFGAIPGSRGQKQAYPSIEDDPKQASHRHFKPGFLSFAGSGVNSRSTHVFITLGENLEPLGSNPWETPFGYVTDESMKETVRRWTTSYGDMAPWGSGPDPKQIESLNGEDYLKKNFPSLDWIKSCSKL